MTMYRTIAIVLPLAFLLLTNQLQADNLGFIELKESRASKSCIAFSPDGTKVLTGCADGTARIWNPETGDALLEFVGHTGHFKSTVFSSDGKKILTVASDNARIWDAETGKQLHILAEEDAPPTYSAAFSPDGKKVATVGSATIGNGDDFVRIWDANTGEVLQRLKRDKSRVWIVSFSPDSKKIITTDKERTIRVWDVDTGEKLFDLALENWYFSAVFSPDGKTILTASQDTTARIWDAETGEELQRLYDHGNGLWYLSADSFSPDGKLVVTTNYGEGGVRVWDPEREREVMKNPGHTSRVWDVETGKELQQLIGHTRAVEHASFLPDGKHIVTRGADHTVRLWEVDSGKELHVLRIKRAMNSFPPAFSPDGRRLALLDGMSARIWDLEALLRSPAVRPPSVLVPFVAQPEAPRHIYSLVDSGELSLDPAQWDDADRKMLFQNMPPQYHQQYTDALAKLLAANLAYWNERAELFRIIHPPLREEDWDTLEEQSREREVLSGNYRAAARRMNREYGRDILHHRTIHAFAVLPNLVDPEKETEYWNACAEELIFLFDTTADIFLKKAEEQKKFAEEFRQMEKIDKERLPGGLQTATAFRSFGFSWEHPLLTDEQAEQRAKYGWYTHTADRSITIPLSDEQKALFAKDEPIIRSIELGRFPGHTFPRFAEWEHLKEARDAELEAWKIDATPELAKLAIEQEDIVRWDASFTLHALARGIAERCEGIDTTPLQTSSGHGIMAAHGFAVLMSSDADRNKTLSFDPNLAALIQGEKDFIFLSRQLSKEEADEWGEQLVVVPFAKDSLVFLQNKYNPVRDLPLEQYRDIFSGKQEHYWSYGGDIKLFIRPENLTKAETVRMLLDLDVEEFKKRAYSVHTGTIGGIITGTAWSTRLEDAHSGGIAFSSYHYNRYVAPSTITRTMAVDGVFPNAETIASGEYPLVYEVVLVHRKNPGERVERFVEWLLSEEGQALVRSVGYVPIR
jgi:WD40 repeat protein